MENQLNINLLNISCGEKLSKFFSKIKGFVAKNNNIFLDLNEYKSLITSNKPFLKANDYYVSVLRTDTITANSSFLDIKLTNGYSIEQVFVNYDNISSWQVFDKTLGKEIYNFTILPENDIIRLSNVSIGHEYEVYFLANVKVKVNENDECFILDEKGKTKRKDIVNSYLSFLDFGIDKLANTNVSFELYDLYL